MYKKDNLILSLYQLKQAYPNDSFLADGPNDEWLTANGVERYSAPVPQPDPAAVEAQRIASLWQAAHDYEYAQVSGSAIGMLALGVLQNKPKCIAVQGWIASIWTEYYTRKSNGSVDYDFSFAGDKPYSVSELMQEVYGG